MHEVLLYGQVPFARHEQVLKILAGIAAMQPLTIYERHIILKQMKTAEDNKPNKKFPNKPVKRETATYRQLIKVLDENAFGKEAPISINSDSMNTSSSSAPWMLQTSEIPEPELKTFVLRPVSETELTMEDMQKLQDPASYGYVAEFLTEGHRLIHKNVVLSLFRVLRISDASPTTPATSLPSLDALKPLDSSGAFVLEARIRIEDRTKPSLVSAATDELGSFRDLMRGSVDMRAPDRLALDTRVR